MHPTPPSPKAPEFEPDPELEPDDEPDPELEPLLAPDDPPNAVEPLDDPVEAPELPDEAAGLPVASPSEEGAPETVPASSPPAGAGLEPHPEPAGGEAELHEARTIAAIAASIERRRSFCLSTFMFGSSCAPATGARISSASPSEAVPPGKVGASTAFESLNNLRRTIGCTGRDSYARCDPWRSEGCAPNSLNQDRRVSQTDRHVTGTSLPPEWACDRLLA